MEDTQFMGLLIGGLATILSIVSILVAIIIKPIINLNKTITKLNSSIDILNGTADSLNTRVSKHGEEIDNLNLHQISQDKDIENHEKRITKLEASRRLSK